MSSDMEALLLVLGGAVEGMTSRRDRNSSVPLSAPWTDAWLEASWLYRSALPRLLQLPLSNPIASAGWLRRQTCLLWSLVLIG